MKTVGIIAEYNPFHYGHAYQIDYIRKHTHADFIVVAMSGDFVQRGAPAIMDKYARAEMALRNGADYVFELPALWATASAEHFAMAGVTLFEKMGCVDAICFGAETDDLALLTSVAKLLVEEPDSYKDALSSYMKDGLNFPRARARAIQACLPHIPNHVLDSPNNILAMEYLKALQRRHSSMEPLLLKREGAGYHETSLDVCNASATGIRLLLTATPISTLIEKQLSEAMPEAAFQVLRDYCKKYPLLTAEDFSAQLGYQLLCGSAESFSVIADSNTEIANRITRNLPAYQSFSQFCEEIKSRDVTYTRMSRILLHLLLQFTNKDYLMGKSMDYIPYLRLLGFRKKSEALLKEIKTHGTSPLLTKLSRAEDTLSPDAYTMLKQDLFATSLYAQCQSIKGSTPISNEYSRKMLIL